MSSRTKYWVYILAVLSFSLFGQSPTVPASSLRFYIDGMIAEFEGDFDRAIASYIIAENYAPNNPEIMLTIAELFLENNDYTQALDWFENLLKIDSENAAYRKGAAEAARGAQQPEIALEHLRWLVKNKKADYPTRFRYATMLLSVGKEKEATKELNAIAEEYPESPDPQGFLGNIYLAKRDFKRAISSFERALELDSTYTRAYNGLSVAYEAIGNDDRAKHYQRLYVESNRFDLDAQRRFIWRLVEDYEYEEAYEVIADYLEIMPNDIVFMRQAAFLAFTLEKYSEAISYFKGVLEANPSDVDARLFYGRALFELGEPLRSIEQYRIILDIRPSADVLVDIALAFSAANEPDSALAAIRQASNEFSESPSVAFYQGVIYSRMRDYANAVISYSEALELEPENPRAMFGLGDALERMGERDSAIAVFRDIIQRLPMDALSANYLGYLLVEEGKELDFADSLISIALSQEPLNPAFIDSYGWLLYKRGEIDSALNKLLFAEELSNPDDPVILEHIGIVLEETGDHEGAKDYYRRAIEIEPDMDVSRQRLKELEYE